MRSKYRYISIQLAVAIFSSVIFSGCSQKIGQVQEDLDLLGVLGLSKADGWSLLTSPDDIWEIGSVMVLSSSGRADWETNIHEEPFSCIPVDYWIIAPSTTPQIVRGKTVNYGIDVQKTFGLSDADISSAMISIGAADETPEYKSTISLTDVTVKRLNRGAANIFIRDNYQDLSTDCQNYINSSNRYIIGETYAIKNGTISITTATGAKVDLSQLEEKIVDAGFSVDNNGSITMVDQEIVVAIRPANFNEPLREAGIELKNKKNTPKNLQEKLIDSNNAIALGITPGTLWGWLGIAVGVAILYSRGDDNGSGDESIPVILNVRPPPSSFIGE